MGCGSLPVDRSTPALEANDYTLALSACAAVPSMGMDLCRVREGTEIASSWKIILPNGRFILGGEIDVYYKDIHRTYPFTPPIAEIPWRDFLNDTHWKSAHDGEALALVMVHYRMPQGTEEIAYYRGVAKIIVTKEGYDRLPVDSGAQAWATKCEVQYSTSGRSAMRCE